MKLTEKETRVLEAFFGICDEANLADQLAAAEPVFSTADEMAAITEMAKNSVQMILRSLVKKGLASEAEGQFILTPAGIESAFSLGQAPEPEVGKDDAAAVGDLVIALTEALKTESKCGALRKIAVGCPHPRGAFIKAAEMAGINRGTAARQWQEARADAPADIGADDKEKVHDFLMDFTHDQLAAKLLEKMSRAEIRAIIKEIDEAAAE